MRGTVKSKDDMERLFHEGRRSSSSLVTILTLPSPASIQPDGRLAFVAGKKLGNAPLRSRCKRVLRACASELGAPWPGFDVVFVARRKLAFAPHEMVLGTFAEQLQSMGVIDG